MAEDAGALLVRSGLVDKEQLLYARQALLGQGGTIGEHLVMAGVIDDQTLADFYRTRLMVPQVSARQLARIAKQIIAKIPADMATEFRCVPVSLDRDHSLTVAMADPSVTHTVDELAFFTAHYVVRAVATPSQIAWCLAHYYGVLTPLGERLLRAPESAGIPGPMPPASALIPTVGATARGAEARSGRHVVPPLAPGRDAHPERAPSAPSDVSTLPLQPPTEDASSGPVPVAIEPDPEPPTRPPPPRLPTRQQRVVSFLQEDTAPTGPIRQVRRDVTNPPELTPRAGEFDVPTGPVPMLDPEYLPPVMISLRRDSDPLSLGQPEHRPLPLPESDEIVPSGSAGPSAGADEPFAEEAPTRPQGKSLGRLRRWYKQTQLGMGFADVKPQPATEPAEPAEEPGHDQSAEGPGAATAREPADAADAHAPDVAQDPAPDAPDLTVQPAGAAPEPDVSDGAVAEAADVPTMQMHAPTPYPTDWSGAAAIPNSAPMPVLRARSGGESAVPMFIEYDVPENSPAAPDAPDGDLWRSDDPPASPELEAVPHLNGALAGATVPVMTPVGEEPGDDTSVPRPVDGDALRPMNDAEGLRRRERSGPVQAPLSLYDSEQVTPEVLREFEAAQDELAEILRQLQLADTRDLVIDILTAHLSQSHQHAAFYALRSGRLVLWKRLIRGQPQSVTPETAPTLNLDQPSTFQDIVGTRLAFRGPVTDRPSRDLIARTFGAAAEQMLGLPVTVRERVVGVLYGDTGRTRVFVENLGVLTRAAGGALERILKNQKGQ